MICVSIQEKNPQACRAILQNCEMAEIRADLCRLPVEELENLVSLHPNLIITCRIENSSPAFAREQITAAIRKGARYVDIEIEAAPEYLEYIRTYAKENGCKLILSYHNFRETPAAEELGQIREACIRKGADLVKIVTTARHTGDAVRTLNLYKEQNPVPLVAFSMGEAGKFSRYLCLTLGAPYTYVSAGISNATAAGQYTQEEMKTLLSAGTYSYKAPKTFHRETVSIPCSKSVAQRAILAAALARGESNLHNYEPCNDTAGAAEAIRAMGCEVTLNDSVLHIRSRGAAHLKKCGKIRTGESGLLTRLLIPLAAYISRLNGNMPVEITGCGSILRRNLQNAADALEQAGVRCETRNHGYLPFRVQGGIARREIAFSGKESSQTVSGFLMALPLEPVQNEEKSSAAVLTVTNPASIPYLDLTLRTLEQFGIQVKKQESPQEAPDRLLFTVPSGQHYTPADIFLDSDWSSAAYFAVAGAIASSRHHTVSGPSAAGKSAANSNPDFISGTAGKKETDARDPEAYGVKGGFAPGITLNNMPLHSLQADEKILEVLLQCGACIGVSPAGQPSEEKTKSRCTVQGGTFLAGLPAGLYDITISARELKAFELDATHCPDLFPVLAVLASHCKGTSRIRGVNRLMQKESNRAESIYTEFTLLGARINILNDDMYITGGPLHGGNVRSHNDHRIAMSLIIAGLFIREAVRLDDLDCIDKSFPSFLSLLTSRQN